MPTLAKDQMKAEASTIPTKRKRAALDSGSSPSPTKAIQDIVDVLVNYDTSPSVLHETLPVADPAPPPSSKRAKLIDENSATNIVSKAQSSSYSTSQELSDDLDIALTSISAKLVSDGSHDDDESKFAADNLERDASALKRVLRSLISQEQGLSEAKPAINGGNSEFQDGSLVGQRADSGTQGTVLTLFGQAQGARQLFSSSQRSVPKTTLDRLRANNPGWVASVAARLPLHEDQLPSGINSTVILPTSAQDALKSSRQKPSFLDAFRPRSSLPPLNPPRPIRRSSTRNSHITWTCENANESHNKAGFTNEKLPSGRWLGYNGVAPSSEPVSPEAKRLQRARTLSTGEATVEDSASVRAAQAQAREDALFRGAYSSFAPNLDNSDTIIPEAVRNEVWWSRYGDYYSDFMFAGQDDLEPPVVEDTEEASAKEAVDEELEEAAIKEAVDTFDPSTLGIGLDPSDTTDDNEDPDLVLADISDLIASLLSHQRIRNSSLRPNTGQASSSQSSAGPKPSQEERVVYESLRSKLALLVGKLPPYALSKVQGDQLSDLVISRHILMEGPDYQGVLEPDQATRAASSAALDKALLQNPGARGTPGARPLPSNGRPGQGFNTNNSPVRGVPSTQRIPLSAWQTPAQQIASAGGQRSAYNAQTAPSRPMLGGFGHARTPSAQQSNGAVSGYATQPQYQQRPQQQPNMANRQQPYGTTNGTPATGSAQQQAYHQSLSRPAGGYYPQSPVGRNSSRTQGSPAAGGPNGSRPHTPATPVVAQASP